MTNTIEYNEWFDEVTSQEYHTFIEGLKQIKPKHLVRKVNYRDVEWRLGGKLVAFVVREFDGSIVHCISNEDIVCQEEL